MPVQGVVDDLIVLPFQDAPQGHDGVPGPPQDAVLVGRLQLLEIALRGGEAEANCKLGGSRPLGRRPPPPPLAILLPHRRLARPGLLIFEDQALPRHKKMGQFSAGIAPLIKQAVHRRRRRRRCLRMERPVDDGRAQSMKGFNHV